MSQEPVETVGNFHDLATAQVAAAALRAEGIDALIPDEYLAGVDWQLGTALHGVRVQVAYEDAEVARALLHRFWTAPAAETPDALVAADPDGDARDRRARVPGVCPACGSESFGPASWKNRAKAIALVFPPLLLAWPLLVVCMPSFTCSACGQSWK